MLEGLVGMIHLIVLLGLYFLAGAKNGSYYAKRDGDNMTWVLGIFIFWGFYVLSAGKVWLIFPMCLVLLWQTMIYVQNNGQGVHLSDRVLDIVVRGGMILCGADIFMLVLTSFATVTAFKIPINLYIGRNWIEAVDGTDNPNGRTVDIWIFGRQWHIPRVSNGWVTLGLGVIGILVWFILLQLGITWQI